MSCGVRFPTDPGSCQTPFHIVMMREAEDECITTLIFFSVINKNTSTILFCLAIFLLHLRHHNPPHKSTSLLLPFLLSQSQFFLPTHPLHQGTNDPMHHSASEELLLARVASMHLPRVCPPSTLTIAIIPVKMSPPKAPMFTVGGPVALALLRVGLYFFVPGIVAWRRGGPTPLKSSMFFLDEQCSI